MLGEHRINARQLFAEVQNLVLRLLQCKTLTKNPASCAGGFNFGRSNAPFGLVKIRLTTNV